MVVLREREVAALVEDEAARVTVRVRVSSEIRVAVEADELDADVVQSVCRTEAGHPCTDDRRSVSRRSLGGGGPQDSRIIVQACNVF